MFKCQLYILCRIYLTSYYTMSSIKMNCGKLIFQDIAPTVINQEVLTLAIEEQGPSGEAAKLFKEDGIQMDKIECLRLSFKRILKIDNIWMLTALTKLSLNNNMIEKIENLDALIHLKELNLSFNYIEKIENINKLIQLENFTLFSNRITNIENMKNLQKLRIFSIGQNRIQNRQCLLHLRKLKKLGSLDIEENPCCNEDGFKTFVAAFLPHLVYLDYKRIEEERKIEGQELYKDILKEITTEEKQEAEKEAKEKKEREDADFYSKSFVEFLNDRQLFDSLFENDPDGELLLNIPDVDTYYKEYETEFLEITKKLFEMGQAKCKIRENEIQEYFDCVETAKKENQIKCQEEIEAFLEKKEQLLLSLRELKEQIMGEATDVLQYTENMNALAEKFAEIVHITWKKLMTLEMNLFEQLSETNLIFERALTELVNNFIEESQGLFTHCRNLEQNYMEQVCTESMKLMTLYNIKEDPDMMPELKALMEDKELLNNAIAASHDIHMQLIDSREDRLLSRSRSWLGDFVDTIQREEIERNRSKILEINHFLDCQREDFEDIQNEGPYLNADISAALG